MEDIFIYGRKSVLELLKFKGRCQKLFVSKGETKGSINEILSQAKSEGIVINFVDSKKLDDLSHGGNHQGVVALVASYKYYEVEDILEFAKSKGEEPFIIILDEIEDPHNLGAIIRTAECAGCHGVVIPKRRSAIVNETVTKTSAGAVEHMRVAMVTNIRQCMEKLKDKGLWIFGADVHGSAYHYSTDLTGPIALVIGNEGKGMSKMVAKDCDVLVRIPMFGQIDSLNASVAAGVLIYEALRQRNEKKA